MKYNHTIHSFANRIRNFLKPSVRIKPANVSEILAQNRGCDIVDQFSDLYYSSRGTMHWRGINLIKNPCDLWTLMDIIYELKPGLIIETGTAEGGSATFYKDITNLFGILCEVVTIDVNPKWNYDPKPRGITSLVGYSTSPGVYSAVMEVAASVGEGGKAILVCLDSDHSRENVRKELDLYAPLVTVGSYVIVEDTNVNGHPSFTRHGPGPWEAVQEFLAETSGFEIDRERQKYLLTFNPDGYLRRCY